jgi:LPXTG-motif cell wall-anchored protein
VPRRRFAALTVALALVTPVTAFAQSAGDEQYQDPFGDEQSQSGDEQSSSGSESQSAQATPTATAAPSTAPAATTAQAQPGGQQLPRTGEDAALLALSGTLLLAGGVVLRRRTA